MSESVERIVAEIGPLSLTEEKALLRAFAAGRVSRSAAMQRMGIDWYGELRARMNELGIRQPMASQEAMKAMDTGANLLSRAMSGGPLRTNFRRRLENLLRQRLRLQQAEQRARHGRAPIEDAQRRLCYQSSTSSHLYNFTSTGRSRSGGVERVVLALDFDGVMHQKGADTDRLFEAMPLLEAWLRERPQVRVVLSTSWKDVHSLAELKDLFSEDIAERIVGATPRIPGGTRQQEIERWLEEQGALKAGARWVALDDQAEEFEPGCPWLVLCDGRLGLTPERLHHVDRLLGLDLSS